MKGEEYAVFDAQPGSYTATYTDQGSGDNGNTGDNGGSTSSSGGQGAGSSTAVPPVLHTATGQPTAAGILDNQKPSDSTTTTTPSNQSGAMKPALPSTDSTDEAASQAQSTFPWWIVWTALGALVVALGLWLFVLWRRRHQATGATL